MMQKRIDWKAEHDRAAGMSTEALLGALKDIEKTLPCSESLDREDGGDRAGFYRDQASVYHAELEFRSRPRRSSPSA